MISTWTTPANDWRQPWEADNGTIATDITTRSALHKAKAKANIATTFTLSEVMNSAKLGSRTPPLSLNEPPATDRASFDEALIGVNRIFRVENSRLRILFTVKYWEQLRLDKHDGNFTFDNSRLFEGLRLWRLGIVTVRRRVAGEFMFEALV